MYCHSCSSFTDLRLPVCGSDSERVVHEVLQGGGGKQGDALMLALFVFGQGDTLLAIEHGLEPGERLLAFLATLLMKRPDRTEAVCGTEDSHRFRGAPGEDAVVEQSRRRACRK